jgi:putative drug exporter of the RND superfamily
MNHTPFFRLGLFLFKHRLLVILLSGALLVMGLPFLTDIMSPFQSTGFIDPNSKSAYVDRYLHKKLHNDDARILVMYHSKTLLVSDPRYIKKIRQSLSGLDDFPLKHTIQYPDTNKKQWSHDKHTAYAVITFPHLKTIPSKSLDQFKASITPPHHMSMTLGGEPIFIDSVNQQTTTDLFHADLIAAPMAIIILLLIFGSVVAAIIPVILGGGCAVIILTTLYAIGHLTTLSIFTINIALLLGLCLSLDYALFIISRFREELLQTKEVAYAIGMTLATAGKAVFFSGLAVFISLSALLLFPVNILFSVAIGGLIAVLTAVVIAIMVLPAILGVLNTRINLLPIRLFQSNRTSTTGFWHSMAKTVVMRPLLFFITTLVLLCVLGAPFLHARLGVSDVHILPKESQSSLFFDAYESQFNAHELTPILLVVTAKKGTILDPDHISALYDFTKKLKKNRHITEINGILTTEPHLKKAQLQTLYASPKHTMNQGIRTLLQETTRKNVTVMRIITDLDDNSPDMKPFIASLRQMTISPNLMLSITGLPVNNADVLDSIARVFPYALLWIIVLTYLTLLVLLRSLFLPLKAIVMNGLSLCATYGILVFVFQEGHFHTLLQFEPQGFLDVSLLVIIFCALFGFSMDYEVFLLTRIQESYQTTKNNDQSIIFGIEHSSRIITSAALIVIVTCGSFMVADVLMVKEFGLGIATAIFVDAFLIRTLFVPATMALVKQWNWYLPNWLKKILP